MASPKKVVSEIPVLSQPVSLGRQVAVNNITLFILKRPGGYNEYVAFPYPGTLFDLSLNSAHAGDPVITSNTDMICTHHKIGKCELFIGPFLG